MVLTYEQVGLVMEGCVKNNINVSTIAFNEFMNKGYITVNSNRNKIKSLLESVGNDISAADIGNGNYILKASSVNVSKEEFKKLCENSTDKKDLKQISKSELQDIWNEKDLAKKKEKALKLIENLKYKSKSVDKIVTMINSTNKATDIDKAVTNLMFVQHGEKVIK